MTAEYAIVCARELHVLRSALASALDVLELLERELIETPPADEEVQEPNAAANLSHVF